MLYGSRLKAGTTKNKARPQRASLAKSYAQIASLLRGRRRGAVLGLLLALRAEFLALLAMQALGVGFLRAFERGGRMHHRLLVHLCGGRSGRRRGRGGRSA